MYGGHLASVHSLEENGCLLDDVVPKDVQAWIGFTDQPQLTEVFVLVKNLISHSFVKQGGFVWTDGSAEGISDPHTPLSLSLCPPSELTLAPSLINTHTYSITHTLTHTYRLHQLGARRTKQQLPLRELHYHIREFLHFNGRPVE